MSRALITGINGQDGAYLAKFLEDKGYDVHGIMRSSTRMENLEYTGARPDIFYGDVAEPEFIDNLIANNYYDEIYNLAAQSHVGQSFKNPLTTMNVNYGGLVNIINAVKKFRPNCKIYQAGTSEMFGYSHASDRFDESVPLQPKSPYAVAKVAAHWAAINARREGVFVANGILFNHESPIRGLDFVTRKISHGVACIKKGITDRISLGNLDAQRDWGFAGDYVEGMWKMLQHDKPDDFVLATGEVYGIRDFIMEAFRVAGIDDWESHVSIDDKNKRPNDLNWLCGDYRKAKVVLDWQPKVQFKELVEMMVTEDLKRIC